MDLIVQKILQPHWTVKIEMIVLAQNTDFFRNSYYSNLIC